MFFTKPSSNLLFTLFLLLTLQVLSVFAAPVALAAPAPVPEPIALPSPAPNTNNPTTLLGRIYHPAANEANTAFPEPIVLRAVDNGSTSTPLAQRDDDGTEALLNRAERFQRRMERRATNRRQSSSEGAQSA